MPGCELQRAWLQKHATPTRANGDFHWHPAGGDGDLRAAAADGLRGATAWIALDGERAAWAVSFRDTAPSDGRAYAGALLTVARGSAPGWVLLGAIAEAPAGRWTDDARVTWTSDAAIAACAPAPAMMDEDGVAAMVAALHGEAAVVPALAWTPRAIAALASWTAPGGAVAFAIGGGAPGPTTPRDRLLARVWRASALDLVGARRIWRAIAALDAARGDAARACAVVERGAAACRDATALAGWLADRGGPISTVGLAAAAPWPWLVARWAKAAPAVRARAMTPLVEAITARLVIDHLEALVATDDHGRRGARRAWRALRLEALVPEAARTQLMAAIRARLPGLLDAPVVRSAAEPAPEPSGG
jgi:hypothetical protein